MMASLYFNKVLADIIWHQSIISCVSTVSLAPMDRPPVCDGKRDGSLLCNFFELLRMFLQKEYTNTVLTNLTSTNSSNTALITSSANLCYTVHRSLRHFILAYWFGLSFRRLLFSIYVDMFALWKFLKILPYTSIEY